MSAENISGGKIRAPKEKNKFVLFIYPSGFLQFFLRQVQLKQGEY